MTAVLSKFRDPEATGFEYAWVGMEPTFQTRKSVKKWQDMSATPDGEDAYFRDRYMLETQKELATAIRRKYRKLRQARDDSTRKVPGAVSKINRGRLGVLRAHLQRAATLVEHHIVQQHLVGAVLDVIGRAQAQVPGLAHRPARLVGGIAVPLGRTRQARQHNAERPCQRERHQREGRGAASHRRLRVNSP